MSSQAEKSFLYPKFAGISDSPYSGIGGSMSKCVGLDIHSIPGVIQAQQSLTKVSSSTITAFCRVSLSLSNGYKLWFSYTDGKIWAQDTSDVFTLVYTTSPSAGATGCLGAIEFNGFVYWATQSRLFRTAITDVPAFGAVAANWQTFSATDLEFHPMQIVLSNKLFIGDGHLVALVDNASAFTANAFDVLTPNRVKCISSYNIDLVLGTIVAQNVGTCQVIRWDTSITPAAATYIEPINENGINCFMRAGEHLLAQAGTNGGWYVYNGQTLLPLFKIPGTWTPTQFGEVYPNASASFKGIPVFGLSNSPAAANTTGNPADQGLYTYGSYSKNYPVVLNGPEYIISPNVVANIEIGSIIVEGNNMYVSWKNGSSYGVDKLDYTLKYTAAYFETLVVNLYTMFKTRINVPPTQTIQQIAQAFADYISMPANCAVTFYYKANNATSYIAMGSATINDTVAQQSYADETIQGRDFQIKVVFTVNGNTSPIVENFGFLAA